MTGDAWVNTGMIFPSAGVRVVIPLVTASFMETASGESMFDLSDYNLGSSIGFMLASAFAELSPDTGLPPATAARVFHDTFFVAHAMFAQDPGGVLMSNLHYDAPGLMRANMSDTLINRQVIHQIEKRRPARSKGRYDSTLFHTSLQAHFGQRRLHSVDKTAIGVATDMNMEWPALFGHVHPALFRAEGIPLSLQPAESGEDANKFMLYGDIETSEAVMAATAIPGFMGYRHVPSLQKHFMDAGAFGDSTLAAVIDDLHDMAVNRQNHLYENARSQYQQALDLSRAAQAQLPAPPKGWWPATLARRFAGAGVAATVAVAHNDAAPLIPEASAVVSRVLILDVGEEKRANGHARFDTTGENGLVAEAENVVRVAGRMVNGSALAQIHKRFETGARAHTGLPAMRRITANMLENDAFAPGDLPSTDIKDGRMDNLLRLARFGEHVCVANREVIIDEINARMKTLQARGIRTPAQVERVAERLEGIRSEEGARAVCESFMITANNIETIMAMREGREPPAPRAPHPVAVLPQAAQGGGWWSGLPRLVAVR